MISAIDPDSALTRSKASGTVAPGDLTGRAALIIGHPGHELCVYGWCQLAKPLVFILTDGSGRTGTSRTARSLHMLQELGCTAATVSQTFTDQEIYRILLDRNHTPLTTVTREITHSLILNQIDYVVGDAGEGFNPVHDVCRLIIDAAVQIAGRVRNNTIRNFGFRLDWRKDWDYLPAPHDARTLTLDQDTFASKLSAAWAYGELRSEVESVLGSNGVDRFRTERLDPVGAPGEYLRTNKPYYEEYAEELVAAGIYDQVIRYKEHLAPLAEQLRLVVQEGL